jgi:hypothetical protein
MLCFVIIASDSTYIISSVFLDVFIVNNSNNHGFIQWFVYSRRIDFVRDMVALRDIVSLVCRCTKIHARNEFDSSQSCFIIVTVTIYLQQFKTVQPT